MGMMDFVRSSYNLGPQFTNVELQTKDIEEHGFGGTMTYYWINPSGYLCYGDYTGTSTLEVYDEGDPKYDPKLKFMNYEWIPTGQKGKYKVYPITKYISVYTSNCSSEWKSWPTLRLHFIQGKLQNFENITGTR